MLNVTRSIVDRLKSDATVSYLVATYRGEPAIFSAWPVPADAARPYIVTDGNVTDDDDDADSVSLRTITRDIACYADNKGSARDVEDIAEAVRSALHGVSFAVDGGRLLVCRCTGPVVAPTDNRVLGRVVTVSLLIN
jgi:hypothetical protein